MRIGRPGTVQVSALFSALCTTAAVHHVLLYAPEEDVACLLRCGGEDGRLVHCWSMPWAEFHWRCAPHQQQSSTADAPAPPQRHAAPGLQGGAASLVSVQRPSLPEGAPRFSKALLQDLVRRREASRASSHLVAPVAPLPPRDAPPAEARSASEEALRRLRLLCTQLAVVLDNSSAQLGHRLNNSPPPLPPPPPRDSEDDEVGRIMRRSKAEAKRLKGRNLSPENPREGRFFYGTAPEASVAVPALPFLKTMPQKTTLGISINFMRRRGVIPFNAVPA